MDFFDSELWKTISQFANGNTAVWLYLVVKIVRYIILPMYRNGKLLKDTVQSLKAALDEGVFGHKEIVAELRALQEVIRLSGKT